MSDVMMAPPIEAVERDLNTHETPGDCSHIVKVPPGVEDESPQAYVTRARIEGFPIEALCGHTWVPARDPKSLPVCTKCREIYEYDPFASDPGRDLPDA